MASIGLRDKKRVREGKEDAGEGKGKEERGGERERLKRKRKEERG